jgi:hypothetical protein
MTLEQMQHEASKRIAAIADAAMQRVAYNDALALQALRHARIALRHAQRHAAEQRSIMECAQAAMNEAIMQARHYATLVEQCEECCRERGVGME